MPTVAPINPLGEKEIAAMLESYVDANQAASMAHAVAQDMGAIGFSIIPSHFNTPGRWDRRGAVRQAEYKLPASDFDINSSRAEYALEGSFLTCGNLLRLAQCCILGQKYIPTLWPSAFTKLLNGKKHLDTLNEVWWLKFWRDIVTVDRGPKMSANDPDFEWEIRIKDGLAPCAINLEAKRRTSNINQLFKKRRPGASTKRIAHKFRAVPDDTANVAALTLFQNIPDSEVCHVHD